MLKTFYLCGRVRPHVRTYIFTSLLEFTTNCIQQVLMERCSALLCFGAHEDTSAWAKERGVAIMGRFPGSKCR